MEKTELKKAKRHPVRRLFIYTLVGLGLFSIMATSGLILTGIPTSMTLLYGGIPGAVFGGLFGMGAGGISNIREKQKLEEYEDEYEEEEITQEEKNSDKDKKSRKGKKKTKNANREVKKALREEKKEEKRQQKLIKRQENEGRKRTKEESTRKRDTEGKSSITPPPLPPRRKENPVHQEVKSSSSLSDKNTNVPSLPGKDTNVSSLLDKNKNTNVSDFTTYRLKKDSVKPKTVLFDDAYNQNYRSEASSLRINDEKMIMDIKNRLLELNRQLIQTQQEIYALQKQLSLLNEDTEEFQKVK